MVLIYCGLGMLGLFFLFAEFSFLFPCVQVLLGLAVVFPLCRVSFCFFLLFSMIVSFHTNRTKKEKNIYNMAQ